MKDYLNELELIEKYGNRSGNSLAFAMYRLEFQIAVTARLAVFLSINYTGITLQIMERGAALCSGNNLPAYLRGHWKKKKRR